MPPRTRVVLTMLLPLLAGCAGEGASTGPPVTGTVVRLPQDLHVEGFETDRMNDSSAQWTWHGTVAAYPGIGVGTIPWAETATFEVPEAVGFRLDLSLKYERPTLAFLFMSVIDEAGRILCAGPCLLEFAEGWGTRGPWEVRIWQDSWPSEDIPFEVSLSLEAVGAWAPPPVAFGGDGSTLPPAVAAGQRIAVRPTGLGASEPTIGVTSDGTLFTPSSPFRTGPSPRNEGDVLAALRSADGGRTWQQVLIPSATGLDFDPWLWIDPDTDRIFRLALVGTCSHMGVSDDGGATWTTTQLNGCGLPAGHYQKLTTGPPPEGIMTRGYPNVVYYGSSLLSDYLTDGLLIGHTAGVWVTPSMDGGASWELGALAHAPRRGCYGWGGPVVVAPDGTAYSPAQFCDGIRIAVSKDAGRTWEEDAMLEDRGHMAGFLGPSMAVDDEGRAYLVYPTATGEAILRVRDPENGAWSPGVSVMPPGVKAATFTLVDAAGPGKVALAFLGTASDPFTWTSVDPTEAPATAAWHLYLVLSWDAFAEDPTFVSFQATPDEDPVQRGCIDLAGSQFPSCRNLADFMDMTLLEGRPIVAFTDGCTRCASAADSRSWALSLAVLAEGLGLEGKRLEAY